MKLKTMFVLCLILWSAAGWGADSFKMNSPDGKIEATISITNEGGLTWRLERAGQEVIAPSALGITVDGANLAEKVMVNEDARGSIDETYPVMGVHSTGVNRCNTLALKVAPHAGPAWVLELRAFNDGFAWRYRVPGQGERTVGGEASAWTVPAKSAVWYYERPNAWKLKSYAGYYLKAPIEGFEKAAKEPVHGPPLVIELPDGRGYAALTEAAVYNYSGMRLRAEGERRLAADFTEGAAGFKISGEIVTPWRVTLAGGDLDTLVNSDVITSLNPPPDPEIFGDASWIKPGRSVWSWLAEAPAIRKSSGDYELQKRYVDMAAGLGFEYSLVDEGWPTWPDAWKQLAGLSAYGRAKGVGIWVWVRSTEISDPADRYRQLRDYLDQVRAAGVAGLKIDFINSEDKAAIDFEEAALTEAGRRKIQVVFHGCRKPTGQARRFPNELSREGVRGMELNFMKEGPLTPDHDAALPFTRYLAGPGDYTPVLLRREYMGATTWAHQVAMAVALTSPFLVIAESPKLIEANPSCDVLKSIPSTWDETRVLPASRIGELALLARRKGTEWFVAAVGGKAAREVTIPLAFLGDGTFKAVILSDAPEKPDAINKEERTVAKGDRITVRLNAGGGCVIRLRP